jgi:geranylgeranyl diphosphate synthase type I
MCLWCCEAAGGDWHDALGAAAAVELLHNFSLIHDDIEDDSEARRGRPTVWKVWGLAQGLNAGDALFVLAQLALWSGRVELKSNAAANNTGQSSLARYHDVFATFNRAALELTQGQYLDLAYERADQLTLEQYFKMIQGKTAALLRASAFIGARMAADDSKVVNSFAEFGQNLGMAFQISDDVLGVWGDPELTGKSARTDLISRKKSYPILLAMQGQEGQELRALITGDRWTEGEVSRAFELVNRSDAQALAANQAEEFAARALSALSSTGLDNPAIDRLSALVGQIVKRDR